MKMYSVLGVSLLTLLLVAGGIWQGDTWLVSGLPVIAAQVEGELGGGEGGGGEGAGEAEAAAESPLAVGGGEAEGEGENEGEGRSEREGELHSDTAAIWGAGYPFKRHYLAKRPTSLGQPSSGKYAKRQKTNEIVTFADPDLEQAVRDAFDELSISPPLGQDIYSEDLVGVGFTELFASEREISDLGGLEYCLDLQVLGLAGNQVNDITEIGSLTDLTYLDLTGNDLGAANLTPLTSLSSLGALSLARNGISDISALAGLTSLAMLDLSFNEIDDVSDLAALVALIYLDIGTGYPADDLGQFPTELPAAPGDYANLIDDTTGLDDLSGLEELTYLNVAGNRDLTDITVLSNFDDLYTFIGGYQDLSGLPSLTGLASLQELLLIDAQLTGSDLTAIGNLTQLTALAIDQNDFTDLSALSALVNLQILSISGNGTSSLDFIADLDQLAVLLARNNAVTDASPLGELPSLAGHYIDITGNETLDNESRCFLIPEYEEAVGLEGAFLHNAPCPQHTLTVTHSGTGNTRPDAGTHQYPWGSEVSLIAAPTPGSGYAFDGWSGDVSSEIQFATVLIDEDKSVEASFIAPSSGLKTLTLSKTGDGEGDLFPAEGVLSFQEGTIAVLTAVPDSGNYFGGWSGAASGVAPYAAVFMNDDKTASARFATSGYPLEIQVAGIGSTEPSPGTYALQDGISATVSASTEEPGWHFLHWEGDLGTADPGSEEISVTIDQARTITAVFEQDPPDFATCNFVLSGGLITPGPGHPSTAYSSLVYDGESETLTLFIEHDLTDITGIDIIDENDEVALTFSETDGPVLSHTFTDEEFSLLPNDDGSYMRIRTLSFPDGALQSAVGICTDEAFRPRFFVDKGNTDNTENGKSWQTAFATIQAAIDAAADAGGGEVWVAKGTYDEERYTEACIGSLQLKTNVLLFGGFNGTEASRFARNPNLNYTIIDGSRAQYGLAPAEHVVLAKDITNFVCDGFILTGGVRREECGAPLGGAGLAVSNTNESALFNNLLICHNQANASQAQPPAELSNGRGGGIYIENAAAEFRNVRVIANDSTKTGGGIYIKDASPTFLNLIVSDNISYRINPSAAQALGGGIYIEGESSPKFINATLVDNYSDSAKGVYATQTTSPIFTNSILWNSSAFEYLGNIQFSACLSGTYLEGSNNILDQPRLWYGPSMTVLGTPIWNEELQASEVTVEGLDASIDSYRGWFIQLQPRGPTWGPFAGRRDTGFIYGNQGSKIYINGNNGYLNAGDKFRLATFYPERHSTARDTGMSTGYARDFFEGSRGLDGDFLGAGNTGDGSDYDIGAIEAFDTPTEPSYAVVEFSDPHVEEAVRLAIGRNQDAAPIMSNEIVDAVPPLSQLDLRGHGIRDLRGLEYCIHLEYLNVADNAITELSPLIGLSQLSNLDLSKNALQDRSSLRYLHGLVTLDLSENPLVNLSDLHMLTNLRALRLNKNEYTDDAIEVLRYLYSVESIELDDNNLTTLTALSGLYLLESISAQRNNIISTAGMAILPSLASLNLDGNPLYDVSTLPLFDNLRHLSMNQCALQDISSLALMTGIESISLRENTISDLFSLTSSLITDASIDVRDNMLSQASLCSYIPKIQLHGNAIQFDGFCGPGYLLTLQRTGNGILTPYEGSKREPSGAAIAIDAQAAPGWRFSHWEDTGYSNIEQSQFTLVLSRSTQLRAVFIELDYSLNITVSGDGSVSPSGTTYSRHGEVVEVTTTAAPGWMFDHWEGDLGSRNPTPAITMLNNKSIVAVFAPIPTVEVEFADGALESVVRGAIEKPTGVILQSDLVGVGFRELLANASGIHSLDGIEYCKDLEYVHLEYNFIQNLAGLEGLVRLRVLDLRGNPLGDVSALSGSENLYLLLLDNCGLTDISSISPLAKLSGLTASNNYLLASGIPSDFNRLALLFLANNPLGTLCDLPGSVQMELLDLRYTSIDSLECISSWPNVRYLLLDGNALDSITPLSPLEEIRELGLANNAISELSPLEHLSELEHLNIENNEIASVEPLFDNQDFSAGDLLYYSGNLLDPESSCIFLPGLVKRGVSLFPESSCTTALTLATEGNGGLLPQPGIYSFPAGSVVSVEAIANEDSTFLGWRESPGHSENPKRFLVSHEPQVVTAVFANAEKLYHSADQDLDSLISLNELLRVIQLYNSRDYHCDAETEDGYAPGEGIASEDYLCERHNSDYNLADWKILLPELLRLIQIYNSKSTYAVDIATEDGFTIGTESPHGTLSLRRQVVPATYPKDGGPVTVTITLESESQSEIRGLAIEEAVPPGWTLSRNSIVSSVTPSNGAEILAGPHADPPSTIATLFWVSPIQLPFTVTYTAVAAKASSGVQEFSGQARYRTTSAVEERSNVVQTQITEETVASKVKAGATIITKPAPTHSVLKDRYRHEDSPDFVGDEKNWNKTVCEYPQNEHDLDVNGDYSISLSELLRLVQFYNSQSYYCAEEIETTEDGYKPGIGENHSCEAHDSDYQNEMWKISLTELLRAIQFYNSGHFWPVPANDFSNEDGYEVESMSLTLECQDTHSGEAVYATGFPLYLDYKVHLSSIPESLVTIRQLLPDGWILSSEMEPVIKDLFISGIPPEQLPAVSLGFETIEDEILLSISVAGSALPITSDLNITARIWIVPTAPLADSVIFQGATLSTPLPVAPIGDPECSPLFLSCTSAPLVFKRTTLDAGGINSLLWELFFEKGIISAEFYAQYGSDLVPIAVLLRLFEESNQQITLELETPTIDDNLCITLQEIISLDPLGRPRWNFEYQGIPIEGCAFAIQVLFHGPLGESLPSTFPLTIVDEYAPGHSYTVASSAHGYALLSSCRLRADPTLDISPDGKEWVFSHWNIGTEVHTPVLDFSPEPGLHIIEAVFVPAHLLSVAIEEFGFIRADFPGSAGQYVNQVSVKLKQGALVELQGFAEPSLSYDFYRWEDLDTLAPVYPRENEFHSALAFTMEDDVNLLARFSRIVDIEDPALRDYVRDALQRPQAPALVAEPSGPIDLSSARGYILESHMESLVVLHIGSQWDTNEPKFTCVTGNCNIGSLNGLESAANLAELVIDKYQPDGPEHFFNNTEALRNLQAVKLLWLMNNSSLVSTVGLGELPRLTDLRLNGCRSISLAGFITDGVSSNLTKLSLADTFAAIQNYDDPDNNLRFENNLNVLWKLPNLQVLRLQKNYLNEQHLTWLSEWPVGTPLPAYGELNLRSNRIRSIDALLVSPIYQSAVDSKAVNLEDNTLSSQAVCQDIPILQTRGISVSNDFTGMACHTATVSIAPDPPAGNSVAFFEQLPTGDMLALAGGRFASGRDILALAVPNEANGWRFESWDWALSGSALAFSEGFDSIRYEDVTSDLTIGAIFARYASIDFLNASPEHGYIVFDETAYSGSSGTLAREIGTDVEVSGVGQEGWTLHSLKDGLVDLDTTSSVNLIVHDSMSITADFGPTLTVEILGGELGTITVNAEVLEASVTKLSFASGDLVSLTAQSGLGEFLGWELEDGRKLSSDNTVEFQIDAPKHIIAKFAPKHSITLSATMQPSGTLSASKIRFSVLTGGRWIDLEHTGLVEVVSGAMVRLTPTIESGLDFIHWQSNTGTYSDNPWVFTVDGSVSNINASFAMHEYGEADIPDLCFLATLKAAAGNPAKLTWEHLQEISDLNASNALLDSIGMPNCTVLSLKGIEYCTNLDSLDLTGASVNDLTPLTSLEHLCTLDLTDTRVSDLRPLLKLDWPCFANSVDLTDCDSLSADSLCQVVGLLEDVHNVDVTAQYSCANLPDRDLEFVLSSDCMVAPYPGATEFNLHGAATVFPGPDPDYPFTVRFTISSLLWPEPSPNATVTRVSLWEKRTHRKVADSDTQLIGQVGGQPIELIIPEQYAENFEQKFLQLGYYLTIEYCSIFGTTGGYCSNESYWLPWLATSFSDSEPCPSGLRKDYAEGNEIEFGFNLLNNEIAESTSDRHCVFGCDDNSEVVDGRVEAKIDSTHKKLVFQHISAGIPWPVLDLSILQFAVITESQLEDYRECLNGSGACAPPSLMPGKIASRSPYAPDFFNAERSPLGRTIGWTGFESPFVPIDFDISSRDLFMMLTGDAVAVIDWKGLGGEDPRFPYSDCNSTSPPMPRACFNRPASSWERGILSGNFVRTTGPDGDPYDPQPPVVLDEVEGMHEVRWDQYGLTLVTNGPDHTTGMGNNIGVLVRNSGQLDEYLELDPEAAPGWKFVGWEGDAIGDQVPLILRKGGSAKSTISGYSCDPLNPTYGTDCDSAIIRAKFEKGYSYVSFLCFTDPLVDYWTGPECRKACPAWQSAPGNGDCQGPNWPTDDAWLYRYQRPRRYYGDNYAITSSIPEVKLVGEGNGKKIFEVPLDVEAVDFTASGPLEGFGWYTYHHFQDEPIRYHERTLTLSPTENSNVQLIYGPGPAFNMRRDTVTVRLHGGDGIVKFGHDGCKYDPSHDHQLLMKRGPMDGDVYTFEVNEAWRATEWDRVSIDVLPKPGYKLADAGEVWTVEPPLYDNREASGAATNHIKDIVRGESRLILDLPSTPGGYVINAHLTVDDSACGTDEDGNPTGPHRKVAICRDSRFGMVFLDKKGLGDEGEASCTSSSTSDTYCIGTELIAHAVPRHCAEFSHWEDEDGNVLGTNPEYSFTVGGGSKTTSLPAQMFCAVFDSTSMYRVDVGIENIVGNVPQEYAYLEEECPKNDTLCPLFWAKKDRKVAFFEDDRCVPGLTPYNEPESCRALLVPYALVRTPTWPDCRQNVNKLEDHPAAFSILFQPKSATGAPALGVQLFPSAKNPAVGTVIPAADGTSFEYRFDEGEAKGGFYEFELKQGAESIVTRVLLPVAGGNATGWFVDEIGRQEHYWYVFAQKMQQLASSNGLTPDEARRFKVRAYLASSSKFYDYQGLAYVDEQIPTQRYSYKHPDLGSDVLTPSFMTLWGPWLDSSRCQQAQGLVVSRTKVNLALWVLWSRQGFWGLPDITFNVAGQLHQYRTTKEFDSHSSQESINLANKLYKAVLKEKPQEWATPASRDALFAYLGTNPAQIQAMQTVKDEKRDSHNSFDATLWPSSDSYYSSASNQKGLYFPTDRIESQTYSDLNATGIDIPEVDVAIEALLLFLR